MCQVQAGQLEALRQRLADPSLDFIVVNQDTWNDRFHQYQLKHNAGNVIKFIQDELARRQMKIWEIYDAEKDDIYIIDACGKIAASFEKPESFLDKGNVERAIVEVKRQSPCGTTC